MNQNKKDAQEIESIKNRIIEQFKQPQAAIHDIMVNTSNVGGRYLPRKVFYLTDLDIKFVVETIDEVEKKFDVFFIEKETHKPDEEFKLFPNPAYAHVLREGLVSFVDNDTIKFAEHVYSIVSDNYVFTKMDVHKETVDETAITYNFRTGQFKPFLPEKKLEETAFWGVLSRAPGAHFRFPGADYVKFKASDEFLAQLDANTAEEGILSGRRLILLHRFIKTDIWDTAIAIIHDILGELLDMEIRLSLGNDIESN